MNRYQQEERDGIFVGLVVLVLMAIGPIFLIWHLV